MLCMEGRLCPVRHWSLPPDGNGAGKGSKFHISCVFEADGSGSSVEDGLSLEVGPPFRSPGREMVRDVKALSPERREWLGEMG